MLACAVGGRKTVEITNGEEDEQTSEKNDSRGNVSADVRQNIGMCGDK